MAFERKNLSLSVDTIGGGSIRIHFYKTTDAEDVVVGEGYFVGVGRMGVRIGDIIMVFTGDGGVNSASFIGEVTDVDAFGAATIAINRDYILEYESEAVVEATAIPNTVKRIRTQFVDPDYSDDSTLVGGIYWHRVSAEPASEPKLRSLDRWSSDGSYSLANGGWWKGEPIGTASGAGFLDEDDLASNSATAAPSQQSVKAYVNSRTVSAGAGLTGGGDLSTSRTISLSSTSIASLALADTAVQPATLEDEVAALDARITATEGLAQYGIKWTPEIIRVRATGNVTIASGLENGDPLNGVTLVTGDHVFLGLQTLPAQNGIYTVVASGAASRATFADSAAELEFIGFLIKEGTAGAGERWTLPLEAASITVGSTALNFAQTGADVSYATEIAAARGPETTIAPRLDYLQDAVYSSASTRLIGRSFDPISSAFTSGNFTFVFANAVVVSGICTKIQFFAAAAGTVKIRRFRLSGGVLTAYGPDVVFSPASSGLKTYNAPTDFQAFHVQAGEHLGFFGNGVVHYSGLIADGDGHYSLSGDSAGAATGSIITNTRLEIQFTIRANEFRSEARADETDNTVSALYRTASRLMGIQTTPVTGTPAATAAYVFADQCFENGYMTEISAYIEATGVFEVRFYTHASVPVKTGSTVTWDRSRTVVIVASSTGPQTWKASSGHFTKVPVRMDDQVGFYGPAVLGYLAATNSDSGGYWPIAGAQLASLTPVLGTGAFGVQLQFGCKIEYPVAINDDVPAWQVKPGFVMKADSIWNHILGYGQSNKQAADAGIITTVPTINGHKTHNVSVRATKPGITGATGVAAGDGLVKTLVEDIIAPDTGSGASVYGETDCSSIARNLTNRLLKSGNTQPSFFMSVAGRSGYSMSMGAEAGFQTVNRLAPIGNWYENAPWHLEAPIAAAAAAGETYQVMGGTFDGLESDLQPTPASYDLVRSRFISFLDTFRVDSWRMTGNTRRPIWFCTSPFMGTKNSPNATMALMDLIDARDDLHYVAPGYRFPIGTVPHYSERGQNLKGAYYARAMHQYMMGRIPDRCHWRSATFNGTTVTARISHPGSALLSFAVAYATIASQLGASSQLAAGGIKVVDDSSGGSPITLSGITIGAGVWNPLTQLYDTEITMTASRSLGTNPLFRYAMDDLSAGRVMTNGADGLVYDNTSETYTTDGVTYIMAHAASAYEMPIKQSE